MDTPGATMEQFEASGAHFEVGFAIGRRFAARIHDGLDHYAFFQNRLLPYHRSPAGQARYRELLRLNRARYPDYVAELEGMAQGAGRPFEELFLVNLRGEYREYLHQPPGPLRGCSDCALLTDNAALIGHNEDGSAAFRGHLFLVHVQVRGKPPFTALAYPGFLCGNAFGFNAEGVCFSVDNVRPRNPRLGVGRHWISRSLLEARSLDDAIARVTAPGRAMGFSYTIGSTRERRIVHVEVAPEVHHVREVQGAYFHANHYQELADAAQIIGPSSRARVERARALLAANPPRDAADVLAVLADQADDRYPIYRTAAPPDQNATLCTALFDLDARQLWVYTDHPVRFAQQVIEIAI